MNEKELLFISEQTNVNLGNDECIWVLDSGLSLHLTPGKSKFPNYTVGDYGHVKMGNDGSCKIVGVCSVCHEPWATIDSDIRDRICITWKGRIIANNASFHTCYRE